MKPLFQLVIFFLCSSASAQQQEPWLALYQNSEYTCADCLTQKEVVILFTSDSAIQLIVYDWRPDLRKPLLRTKMAYTGVYRLHADRLALRFDSLKTVRKIADASTSEQLPVNPQEDRLPSALNFINGYAITVPRMFWFKRVDLFFVGLLDSVFCKTVGENKEKAP